MEPEERYPRRKMLKSEKLFIVLAIATVLAVTIFVLVDPRQNETSGPPQVGTEDNSSEQSLSAPN